MFRAWLRHLIGWKEFEGWAAIEQHNSSIAQGKIESLETQVADLKKDVEALKYMRTQRENKAQNRQITDWERIQAEFAANPENFKEN